MVKENEIKIGNWFQHNANWCYRSPAEVKPFLFQWEARDWYALGECTLSLEDIEPIPLAITWAIKLGFKKHDNSNEFWNHFVSDNGWHISQALHTEPSAGVREGYFYYGESYLEVEFVHELQSLFFALCKKELNYHP